MSGPADRENEMATCLLFLLIQISGYFWSADGISQHNKLPKFVPADKHELSPVQAFRPFH